MIQITAGRGPAECCRVVAQVLKMLLAEAMEWGLSYNVVEREAGPENGTLLSAAVKLEGKEREAFFSQWEGSILWTGQSPYRKYHKRKNWFVGVNRLRLANETMVLKDQDIRYEATRAGGPGGQHVNKVSTAVRATHLPTRISVLASDYRSQLQNKKAARERLEKRLAEYRLKDQQANVREGWQQHDELERGNPVRVFTGTGFKPEHSPKKQREKRTSLKQEWKKELLQENKSDNN